MAVEWWIHGSREPCGNVMSRPHGPHSWESCVVEIIGNGARLWFTSESELCSLASVCWDRDVSHSKFTNISITIIVIKTDTADHSCCTAPHLAVRELDGSGEPQSLFFFFFGFLLRRIWIVCNCNFFQDLLLWSVYVLQSWQHPWSRISRLTDSQDQFASWGWRGGGQLAHLHRCSLWSRGPLALWAALTSGLCGFPAGEVLVFLDSHCEVNVLWLQPLLAAIREDRRMVVCPVIDIISADTLAYSSSPVVRGGFNWGLHFKWDLVPLSELGGPEGATAPIK